MDGQLIPTLSDEPARRRAPDGPRRPPDRGRDRGGHPPRGRCARLAAGCGGPRRRRPPTRWPAMPIGVDADQSDRAQRLLGLVGTAIALYAVQVIVGALQIWTTLAAVGGVAASRARRGDLGAPRRGLGPRLVRRAGRSARRRTSVRAPPSDHRPQRATPASRDPTGAVASAPTSRSRSRASSSCCS